MAIVKPALTPWLRPAQGFFNLGMFEAARANLDDLEASAKAHPETLMFRLEILLALDKPYQAAALGADYCRDWPAHGEFFLKTAEALMKLPEYDEALLLLRSAPESLHREAEYHYRVASCACRAGRFEEAKAALSKCYWDFTIQQLVLMDPAFESLWRALGRPEDWGLASGNRGIDPRNLCDWSKGHWIGPAG